MRPACGRSRSPPAPADRVAPRTAPGKLIYSLYGSKTEDAFVKTWGIGLALENATAFQELLLEAWQAFLVLMLLDLVRSRSPAAPAAPAVSPAMAPHWIMK